MRRVYVDQFASRIPQGKSRPYYSASASGGYGHETFTTLAEAKRYGKALSIVEECRVTVYRKTVHRNIAGPYTLSYRTETDEVVSFNDGVTVPA